MMNIVIFFIFILFTILPISFNNFTIKYNINNIEYFLSNINNKNINYNVNSIEFINNSSSSDLYLTFFSEIEVLGHNLYTYGAIYLIILSIILLLAMLATIVLSKQNKNI